MKKEFIVERNGKSFVLYAGLLDAAHEKGLESIVTTLVQIPSDLNGMMAIVHASVSLKGAGTFTGLGDAAPDSVSRMMVPHLIRMAETRAKARALRDAVNVGVTALEELGEMEADSGGDPGPDNGPRRSNLRTLEPRDVEPEPREPTRLDRAIPGHQQARMSSSPGAAPATPKQLQTIQRMARASGKPIPTESLTRAQASEIISSLIGELDDRGGAPSR